jgi:Sap, sulfolipid-1-addressing protein
LSELLTVLPLAIVMVAGPQIVSSVFLATSVGWARNSAAYVIGAACSISLIVAVTYFIVDGATGSDNGASTGSEGDTLDIIILVLLLVLAVRVYMGRKEAEPPKWMGKLQEAKPAFSFKLGFLLLGVFPTDIITSVTVATKLAREGEPLREALGFLLATLFLLALPALLVLALGARARELLPKVREWMNANSWLVSEFVIAIFVVIELNSILGD